MNFEQTPEFQKELKALRKKWRTLADDLGVLIKVLPSLYLPTENIPVQHVREAFFGNKKAAVLHKESEDKEIIKIRLDCQALGNKDILRIIYMRNKNKILFIELFAKNEKSREDSARIKKYLPTL